MMKPLIFSVAFLIGSFSWAQTTEQEAGTNDTDKEVNALEQIEMSLKSKSIVGLWEMTVDSPRGRQNSKLTISESNGSFFGKTSREEFDIEVDGDQLSWKSRQETPRGPMEAICSAKVSGNTMKGTMEMTSGMMAGRKVNFSAVKK